MRYRFAHIQYKVGSRLLWDIENVRLQKEAKDLCSHHDNETWGNIDQLR